MIVTELYDGQGLGNQLWCYVVTRIIAEKNNYDFGIMGIHKFKGREFMNIDYGKPVIGGYGPEGGPPILLPEGINNYYKESSNYHQITRLDITKSDINLLNVSDNTKIDGIMQSFEYVKKHKNEIMNWLITKPNNTFDWLNNDDVCIIHIRGGDFNASLAMLDSNYYNNAINNFKKINPNIKFYVVTDDVNTSRRILPNIDIVGAATTNKQDSNKASHHIGGPISIDYSILNNAKNIIMSASSFGWWSVWTNKNNPYVIAPKYWAAYKENNGYWSCGEALTDGWYYMDISGQLFDDKMNLI
jgi:hypothetical protein